MSAPIPETDEKVREAKDSQLTSSALGVQTLAELRAVPAEKLLNAFFKPGGENNFAFWPDVDGYFLPEPTRQFFQRESERCAVAGGMEP